MIITVFFTFLIRANTDNLSSKVLGQTDADKINIGSKLNPEFEPNLNFSEELRVFNQYFPHAWLISMCPYTP